MHILNYVIAFPDFGGHPGPLFGLPDFLSSVLPIQSSASFIVMITKEFIVGIIIKNLPSLFAILRQAQDDNCP
jgi:hypothetical protein